MKDRVEPAAIADCIRGIKKNLAARTDAPKAGKLSIRKCGEDDIPGVIAMMADIGIPMTAEGIIPLLKFGELWCLDNSGVIVATGGWLPHGAESAWIGMIMTVPAWRKLSIATCFMKLVLERTADYPVRMLDASDLGEPIYRRLGFAECAKVHMLGVPVGSSPAPRLVWRPMREADFPLPGTDDKDPAHRYIFGSDPALCRTLEKDGRIAGWFLGCEKHTHVHIGQIYAEDEDIAVDAFHAAREMLPGRKLTLAVPPTQKKLFAAVSAAGARLLRIHTRMYLAEHPVPPVPPGIRSSAGPGLG